MKKKDFLFIFFSFLIWRVLLLVIELITINFVPVQNNFLGGGIINYLKAPLFWGWANFDGEHYISIAQHGYGLGEQAFFPLYPVLIKIIAFLFLEHTDFVHAVGLIISNISFFIGLIGFYKLIKIDFSNKIAKICIVFLLLFPTSFYFGSTYTEGLFFSLTVWSFYFARKENWLSASILGMFASATRVLGVLLAPAFALMILKNIKFDFKKIKMKHFYIILIPFGIFLYMCYLYLGYDDPLLFLKSVRYFGEQRSTVPIVLPQVFYRYIFKIIPNLNYSYIPVVFTTAMEFVVSLAFLGLAIYSFFKLNIAYSIYLTLGYIASTINGSFSSLPRYVLVLFPAFIIVSIWLEKLPKVWKTVVLVILFVLLAISQSLFFRGYWIS